MKLFQLSICLTSLLLSGCFQSQDHEIAVRFEKFHKNGKLKISGFKNEKTGRSTGEWKYYDNNGHLKESGFFRNGKEHGEWNRYNQSGEIISTSYYSNGKNFRTVIPWD